MQKLKKIMCLLLSALMILSMGVPAFAVDKTTANNSTKADTQNNPLTIEISTDKEKYKALGIAKITATVTNTSNEDIQNVSAEAVFTDLAPVGKSANTKKEVETLKAGESISFTYKATLNKSEHKLNFLQKIFLWLVRLFNGGFTAKDNGFDNGRECTEQTTPLIFGKFEADNVIKVWYGEKLQEISDDDFNTFQNIRKSIENLSEKEEVINILENEIKKGYVTSYQISENYITFETIFGIRGIWEDESLFNSENKTVSLDNKSNKVKKTPSGNTYKNIINQVTTASIISSLGDVAVIRPYRSTDFQYDDFLTTGEIIADALGVEIDTFDNANATLSVLESLDDYSIILIDSHGTLIGNEPHICLTQTYNNQQISSSDLDSIFINQNNEIRVNSNFFDDNYNNNFGDCIVFLGTCYGMFNNSIADALINNGVDCVYGYTNPVSVTYCNNTLVESILENLLLDGTTSSIAYNNTVSVCGRTDPNNENTDFVTQQSSDFCLSRTGYTMGVIKDNITNNVLSNVKVTASNELYTTTAATDENGTFKIKLPIGKYTLTMSLDGHNYNQKREIVVEENVAKTEGVIYLYHGIVSGTVKNIKNNKPVTDVNIECLINDTEDILKTTTDINGNFSIKLPYNDYSVTFNRYGYNYYGISLTVDCNNVILTEPILLSQSITDGNVVGVVKDSSNKPLQDVLVEAIPKDSTNVINSVITDVLGNYSIPLPHGEYTLQYSKDGYKTTTVEVNFDEYSIKPVNVVVLEQGEDTRPVTASGDCGADGDNVKWTLYEDGELVINGQGDMEDWYSQNNTDSPWYEHRNMIKSVIIADGVTKIGRIAFKESINLEQVTLGNAVETIGAYAFLDCNRLVNIDLNNKIRTIGKLAFSGCGSLSEITIPASVTYIGDSAFNFCHNYYYTNGQKFDKNCYSSKLININVDKNNMYYASVDGVLFNKEMSRLIAYPIGRNEKEYTIPHTVKSIDDSAFSTSNLTTVRIPESVNNIGENTFELSSIDSIEIPSSVTAIGFATFHLCEELEVVKLNNGITNIDSSAFSGCTSLTSISIPDSVTSIGNSAFYDCTSLTNITIPDSVTSIGSSAFSGCTSLEKITINNPSCVIYDSENTISDTATIYGYSGSTAQAYAEKYNRKFVAID